MRIDVLSLFPEFIEQSAGFGVASTVPLDERLYISNSGKQVAWLYNDGSSRCAGLWVDSKGLYRLPPKAGCANASTAMWNASERMPMALMPTAADGSLITFSGEQGEGCSIHDGSPMRIVPCNIEHIGNKFNSAPVGE